MKTFLLFIFLLSFQFSYSQVLLPHTKCFDLKYFELQGKIKSVTWNNFEVLDSNETGLQLRKYTYNDWDNAILYFNPEGWFTKFTSYQYDSLGKEDIDIEGSYKTNKKGDMLNWKELYPNDIFASMLMTYTLDKNGLLTKAHYEFKSDMRTNLHVTDYTVSDEKYVSSKVNQNNEDIEKINYFYKENPKMIIVDHYSTEKSLQQMGWIKNDASADSSEWIFTYRKSEIYDSENRLSHNNSHIGHTDSIQHYEKYTYDENGRLLKDQSFSLTKNSQTEERMTSEHLYTYDEKGNKIIWSQQNFPEGEFYIQTYVYKYDKNGNWTRRIRSENGKSVWIEERKIDYYK